MAKRGVIIVGGYGSGKTEVAINYARALREDEWDDVLLVDLDVVNPYFRSREARQPLESLGVRIVAPRGEQAYADIPIILPEVRHLVAEAPGRCVIDVGGDDVGAVVLASLHDVISARDFEIWAVVNGRRPFTQTLQGVMAMVRAIESAGNCSVGALVANTHLLHETTLEIVLEGLDLTRRAATELSVRVARLAVAHSLAKDVASRVKDIPLLPLTLTMRRPWERVLAAP